MYLHNLYYDLQMFACCSLVKLVMAGFQCEPLTDVDWRIITDVVMSCRLRIIIAAHGVRCAEREREREIVIDYVGNTSNRNAQVWPTLGTLY
jgi:hypothetical protein